MTYSFRDSVYHTKIDGVESYEIYLGNFKCIKYNGKNELATLCSILTSESMEELKLNDEFNVYYDYEVVIRKEKL